MRINECCGNSGGDTIKLCSIHAAAPDMLAVLRSALDACHAYQARFGGSDAIVRAIQSAIDKADGR